MHQRPSYKHHIESGIYGSNHVNVIIASFPLSSGSFLLYDCRTLITCIFKYKIFRHGHTILSPAILTAQNWQNFKCWFTHHRSIRPTSTSTTKAYFSGDKVCPKGIAALLKSYVVKSFMVLQQRVLLEEKKII